MAKAAKPRASKRTKETWRNVRPGAWAEDTTEFEGAKHVALEGNLVEVFPDDGSGCYRFRRIKGKLVRTG
jgi:hypothetical protein